MEELRALTRGVLTLRRHAKETVMDATRDGKIDYIEFTSKNLEATKAFYQTVFGWSFEDYGPDYTSFSDGRLAGGLQRGETGASSGPLVVIFVDDLEGAEQRVRAAGGSITKERFSFPGGSRFHFRDPSGNELAAWHAE
jgi:predicted enzyme related to lactoylglutathione lyase